MVLIMQHPIRTLLEAALTAHPDFDVRGNGDSKRACSLTLLLSFLITAVERGDLSRYHFWKPHSFCTWACLCCPATAA